MDSVPGTPAIPGLDKVAHFGMYGLIGWFAGRGWRAVSVAGRRWALASVVLIAGMGAADEYRQSLVPGRSAEVADWLADALGAGTGLFLGLRMNRRRSDDEVSDERE